MIFAVHVNWTIYEVCVYGCVAQHISKQLVGGLTESRMARGQGPEPAETPLVHVSTFCGLDLPSPCSPFTFLICFHRDHNRMNHNQNSSQSKNNVPGMHAALV